MKTPCSCENPGFCPLHQFVTTSREHELCRTRMDYFNLFASGKSPQKARENGTFYQKSLQAMPVSPEQVWTCTHRGAQVSSIGCKGCGGSYVVPVFDCAIHEECTVNSQQPQTACCAVCPDRSASP